MLVGEYDKYRYTLQCNLYFRNPSNLKMFRVMVTTETSHSFPCRRIGEIKIFATADSDIHDLRYQEIKKKQVQRSLTNLLWHTILA